MHHSGYLINDKDNCLKLAFSRKGCSYDNSCIESFHSVLKKEEVYCRVYKYSDDAYNSIFEYIESWYTHTRAYSSLGYMTLDAVYAEGVAQKLHFKCPLH